MPVTFPWRLFTASTVNATAAITSSVLDCQKIQRLESLSLLMTSTGSAHDVKVQMVASSDASTFSDVTDFTTLTSSTATDFPNSASKTIIMPLPLPLARYVKIIITGVGSNPADTAVTAVLTARES